MREILLFVLLVGVCLASYGGEAQLKATPHRAEKFRVEVSEETLVTMRQKWQKVYGDASKLEEFHRLLLERAKAAHPDRAHLETMRGYIIELKRNLTCPRDAIPVRLKNRKRAVKKSPFLPTVGVANTTMQKESNRPVPTEFNLNQNFPNPFNPTTSIQYSVVGDESPPHVSLEICNLLGQKVRRLVDAVQELGYYTVTWDGRDDNGRRVCSGVYFYTLRVSGTPRQSRGDFLSTKKMILMK